MVREVSKNLKTLEALVLFSGDHNDGGFSMS
jgi:hypothetical protein